MTDPPSAGRPWAARPRRQDEESKEEDKGEEEAVFVLLVISNANHQDVMGPSLERRAVGSNI